MNIKEAYELLKAIPTGWKIGLGLGSFFIGRGLLNATYSKIYSMHSGTESSMSSYVNKNITDFGSGWKGLNNNILKLVKQNKNSGLGNIMKESITAFTNKGVNLGKTMIKVNRPKNLHNWIKVKDKVFNPVLNLHDKRNIGHIVS